MSTSCEKFPKILLFLLITLEFSECSDLNVGTTLFTKADTYKECWSSESLALLTSRMILEDLLPSTAILVIDSNEFVTDLVEYFRLILEIVREETSGKTKHVTLVALTDLLGGYLYHAVLPIAKYAYYAGSIDVESIESLLGLFDELKWFLRTNGQGWAKPLPQNAENFEILRIPLQPCNDKSNCKGLIVVENADANNRGRCDVTIPLPFFDSVQKPSAVAIPTQGCSLHNVESANSSHLLMKFFVTSYKCLQSKNVRAESIAKFTEGFSNLIEHQIMPLLNDERFYAAFGGILRVRNTVKRLGLSQTSLEKQIGVETPDKELLVAKEAEKTMKSTEQMSKTGMILTAVLITIIVWFFLGTLFICYRMRITRRKGPGKEYGYAATPTGTDTTGSSLDPSNFFFPKATSSTTSVTSGNDDRGKNKGRKRRNGTKSTPSNIGNNGDGGDNDDYPATIDAKNEEKRLPSILEMSEKSSESNLLNKNGTRKNASDSSTKKISFDGKTNTKKDEGSGTSGDTPGNDAKTGTSDSSDTSKGCENEHCRCMDTSSSSASSTTDGK